MPQRPAAHAPTSARCWAATSRHPPRRGEPDPAGGDPAKTYAAVRKLRTVPITKAVLLPLGIAALVPLIAVGATQLPFKELLKVAKMLLL